MALDIEGIYQRLEEIYQVSNQEGVGAKLGKTIETMRTQKYRRSFPEAWKWYTMLVTGCTEGWLLRGELPKYRGDLVLSDLAAPIQATAKRMLDMSPEVQALVERVASLVQTCHPDPVKVIEIAAMIVEEQTRAAEALRNDVPLPEGR
jgi:hypothetical protein